MSIDLALEIAGFSLGLLYLWWEYHADARLWLASVVMPAISMWIYFRKGLYADFGINIYYLAIAAYGYWAWTRSARSKDGHAGASRKEKAMPVRHIPFRVALGSARCSQWCGRPYICFLAGAPTAMCLCATLSRQPSA